ncbi:hypothetical protein TNCV_4925011 [Trichonephila clavipes]|nr:hypothetical protein TNCV_4925011 [Trichonephila clavipes]
MRTPYQSKDFVPREIERVSATLHVRASVTRALESATPQRRPDRTHDMPAMVGYLNHWATAAPQHRPEVRAYDKYVTATTKLLEEIQQVSFL